MLFRSGHDLRVGFSANGVNDSKYFLVPGTTTAGGQNNYSNTPYFPVKCTSIFLRRDGSSDVAGVSIFAGLTSIPKSELDNAGISGSNWSGSSGVG